MPDYRSLPSVTALASIPELAGYPESIRIRAARKALNDCRRLLARSEVPDPKQAAIFTAHKLSVFSMQSVRNYSGVILHTGLGRAPLQSIHTMPSSISGYSNLEFDLATGKRGDRQDHVRTMLSELTGAEDSLVVNNGAGAVLLALSALCSKKEVLLSRGQSIEIGGAFRMPDVIKASGCKLVDVGTTNKTRGQDYVEAITSKTSAILQCHPSNFEVKGFTSAPTSKELAEVAHRHGVLFINDQGNGAIVDFKKYGIHGIETMPQSVAAKADITIGSGDKLLGGPQCGIILGRKDLIAKMARHPLARALRIDKTNLSLLSSVLTNYVIENHLTTPLFAILDRSADEIRKWCEMIAPEGAEVLETVTELGSGSAPGQGVKSFAVVLKTTKPNELLAELLDHNIVGRIHKGKVWLDPRTAPEPKLVPRISGVLPEEDRTLEVDRSSLGIQKCLAACWEKWK